MSISHACLRIILLTNLIYWGWYLIDWDWQGFQTSAPNANSHIYGREFWTWNVIHVIMVAAWFAGLIGLFRSHWSRNSNFIISAIMFGIFVLVDWGEYRHDSAYSRFGNFRGALTNLLISVLFLTANLWALAIIVWTKLKPENKKPH